MKGGGATSRLLPVIYYNYVVAVLRFCRGEQAGKRPRSRRGGVVARLQAKGGRREALVDGRSPVARSPANLSRVLARLFSQLGIWLPWLVTLLVVLPLAHCQARTALSCECVEGKLRPPMRICM